MPLCRKQGSFEGQRQTGKRNERRTDGAAQARSSIQQVRVAASIMRAGLVPDIGAAELGESRESICSPIMYCRLPGSSAPPWRHPLPLNSCTYMYARGVRTEPTMKVFTPGMRVGRCLNETSKNPEP